MRPPPFILVLNSNAPDSSETARTKGGRIMFREKKSGAEMENMAALWTSVFWSCPSPARAPQRRHPGLLGPHRCPVSNRLTQGGTGAARRDFFSWCVKAPQHFLSLQIKWVRASARNTPVFRRRQDRQSRTGALLALPKGRNLRYRGPSASPSARGKPDALLAPPAGG